jgi:hypothetical protein
MLCAAPTVDAIPIYATARMSLRAPLAHRWRSLRPQSQISSAWSLQPPGDSNGDRTDTHHTPAPTD